VLPSRGNIRFKPCPLPEIASHHAVCAGEPAAVEEVNAS
jgi:hypothetical protein